MSLLHRLRTLPGVGLTVAHFDHGIRADSAEDRRLVKQVAVAYGLPFVYAEGHLGPGTSEASARAARYDFLHRVRQSAGARAIVTAHHQDDAIETAIINLIRGTNRKGASGLRSTEYIKRPLLHLPKTSIRKYAAMEGLVWREDSSNADPAYLRNRVRQQVMTKLSPQQRTRLHDLIVRLRHTNEELDALLKDYLQNYHSGGQLDRHQFTMLPHTVARETMAAWLRQNDIRNFDTKTLERLVRGAKTMQAGKRISVDHTTWLQVNTDSLALVPNER